MRTLAKAVISCLVFVLSLIPTWLFLLLEHFAQPNGFWQKLVLLGFGIYFLGIIQIVLLIEAVVIIIIIFLDDVAVSP